MKEQYFVRLQNSDTTIIVAEKSDYIEAIELAEKTFDWVLDAINNDNESISNFAKSIHVVVSGPRMRSDAPNEERAILFEKWFEPNEDDADELPDSSLSAIQIDEINRNTPELDEEELAIHEAMKGDE